MHKRFILLGLILIISLQELTAQKSTFSLRGGLTIANLLDKENEIIIEETEVINGSPYETDTKPKIGFNLGIISDIPISAKISFQPELGLSLIQYQLKNNFYGISGRYITSEGTFNSYGLDPNRKTSLLYVEFPLLIAYQTGEKFSFSSGITFNYLVSSIVQYQAFKKNTSIPVNIEDTTRDAFNDFLWGFELRVQYQLNNHLQVETALKQNISNTYDSDILDSRQFNLSVGVLYNLSK